VTSTPKHDAMIAAIKDCYADFQVGNAPHAPHCSPPGGADRNTYEEP
jgi:hypothetical protein